ncbi:MAG: DHH family phosphoesterase, partial [Lachnospiraceae bacterium]|nr:DHH family phosphoesterase [Lachnospiraceae bacterium]
LVTQYFVDSHTTMDTNTATILLYGIRMDTASFTRGVTDLDIEMFAYLHRLADNQEINDLYSNTMGLDDLYAYGEAIKTIQIYENVGFAKISFDCPDGLIAMISDFILGLDIVEFSVVYAVRNGGLKFSVRNENMYYHAGTLTAEALADIGGGGGHYSMAGGMVPAAFMEKLQPNVDFAVRTRFMNAIEKMRKENEPDE